MDKEFVSLHEWAKDNVGGLTVERVFGMHGPKDLTKVGDLYDEAFTRFKSLASVGKRNFCANQKNSAISKEDLIIHANIAQPRFLELLNTFTGSLLGVHFSSGPENACLIKHGEGFNFKLKYRDVTKITDMIRSTVICHSIDSLHSTVVKFIKYCSDIGIEDVAIVNFYDNVAKFGNIDRADENSLFGYVGIHVTIPLKVSTVDCEDFVILAEVQFHPSTIYDGTFSCLKEMQHDTYRAFHTKEAQKDPAVAALARSAVLMAYAHAMASTPET